MRILSLFDGISCGQQALKDLGIPITQYFASEINASAITVTQENHPQTIQLGDVRKLNVSELPPIDLLLAGFPCQDFSLLGRQAGLDGNRGQLFFDLMRIFQQIKPKYFLFENVVMAKENRAKLDSLIGVPSVRQKSNAFSAQSRDRLYWTNLNFSSVHEQSPEVIENILDPQVEAPMTPDRQIINQPIKNARSGIIRLGAYLRPTDKTIAGFRLEQRLISSKGKHPTLLASPNRPWVLVNGQCRKLSIDELVALQGLPRGYVSGISFNQACIAVGNGWQVDTIKQILAPLKVQ
jgi:site-specific DNA-cytosine methylase